MYLTGKQNYPYCKELLIIFRFTPDFKSQASDITMGWWCISQKGFDFLSCVLAN